MYGAINIAPFFLKKCLTLWEVSYRIALVVKTYARVAQLVEHDLAKVGVAGSSPVSRSYFLSKKRYPVGYLFF